MKVLVADYTYADTNTEKEIIESAGMQFLAAHCRTEDELIKAARGANAIIVQYAPVTAKVIGALPCLQVIGRYGVGVDGIDAKAAREKGIAVVNVPDYCVEEVSDHALALLLSLMRKVHVLHQAVKSSHWSDQAARPIRRFQGSILGLVGFGHIARRIAEKLRPFGVKIIVFDPFISACICNQYKVNSVDFQYLLKTANYISLHVPMTHSTKAMIGMAEFKKMKRDVILINTARGELIDELAMIQFFQQHKNAFAGLDVLEEEYLDKSSPLMDLENIVITPHVAWYSEESQKELQTKIAKKVVDTLNMRPQE